MYSAVPIHVVKGCVNLNRAHATFDLVYLDSRGQGGAGDSRGSKETCSCTLCATDRPLHCTCRRGGVNAWIGWGHRSAEGDPNGRFEDVISAFRASSKGDTAVSSLCVTSTKNIAGRITSLRLLSLSDESNISANYWD